MIIKKEWLRSSYEIQLLDEDRDLWLINDPFLDDEGFEIQNYHIATSAGPAAFETISPIGSSYSTFTEINAAVKEWFEKNTK